MPQLTGSELTWGQRLRDAYNKDPAVRRSHNCFAFALGIMDKAKIRACREKGDCSFHVPGRKNDNSNLAVNGKHPEFSGNMGKTCSDVIARTMATEPNAYLTTYSQGCKKDERQIGVMVDSVSDMHYSQVVDCDPDEPNCVPGQTVHKPGETPATDVDGRGAKIINPERAYWFYPKRSKNDIPLSYKFCKHLCIPANRTPTS